MIYDLIIIGAGPAGLSSGLRAKELNLNYLILEKEKICNFIIENYISEKIVSYAPKDLKLEGNLWFQPCKTEELLKKWREVAQGLNIHENEEVLDIEKKGGKENTFLVLSNKEKYFAKNVIVAIGNENKPKKLNVECENLWKEKVFYTLKNQKDFQDKEILIVGGGDSAVDAALALCENNNVTLSYRREKFFRLNEENSKNIEEKINSGKIKVLFNSNVKEIREDKVLLNISEKEEEEIKEIKNDFVFIFIGYESSIAFFKKINGVKIKEDKVLLDENFQSSLQGLFIIGDASGKPPFLIKPAINQGYRVVNFISSHS